MIINIKCVHCKELVSSFVSPQFVVLLTSTALCKRSARDRSKGQTKVCSSIGVDLKRIPFLSAKHGRSSPECRKKERKTVCIMHTLICKLFISMLLATTSAQSDCLSLLICGLHRSLTSFCLSHPPSQDCCPLSLLTVTVWVLAADDTEQTDAEWTKMSRVHWHTCSAAVALYTVAVLQWQLFVVGCIFCNIILVPSSVSQDNQFKYHPLCLSLLLSSSLHHHFISSTLI